ncbi:MAG: bifunctional ornithine acetyltransferase/N-acetylglutamate synthase [Oscillospiraceae bacterium]|nr:bifunctional ornithine acetyltransferase/N-acetylglutamate synthase [Oscillospiraceae bacterium]
MVYKKVLHGKLGNYSSTAWVRANFVQYFGSSRKAWKLLEHGLKVDITLYEGDAYDRMFTCDFSYDYVKINGSYKT